MLLNPKERLMFMTWCRQQANDSKAIADQIDKSMAHGMAGQLSKRERQKAAAFMIVAMELASVREEFSVKSEDIGEVNPEGRAMSRAITSEELRDQVLEHMRSMVHYWANVESASLTTVERRLEGFGHSILVMLDGCSMELPAFDLVAKPDPDDKQYCIDNGEDWIEDETRISCQLHDHWFKQ